MEESVFTIVSRNVPVLSPQVTFFSKGQQLEASLLGQLLRYGELHNRSFIIRDPHSLTYVLGDTIDDSGSYSVKGLPLETPYIQTDGTQNGVRAHQLLPKDGTEFLVDAVEVLTSLGIKTEKIYQVCDIQTVPYRGVSIPVDTWKELVLQSMYAPNTTIENLVLKSSDKRETEKFITGNTFVALFRSMPFEGRIADLERCISIDQCVSAYVGGTSMYFANRRAGSIAEIEKAAEVEKNREIEFYHHNLPEVIREIAIKSIQGLYDSFLENLHNNPHDTVTSTYHTDSFLKDVFFHIYQTTGMNLNVKNSGDIEFFFRKFAPKQMGAYLACLHNYTIIHRNPHAQNWTGDISLVDLCSMRGSLIDGYEPVVQEYVYDITRSIEALDVLLGLQRFSSFKNNANVGPLLSRIKVRDMYTLSTEVKIRFLTSYFESIYDTTLAKKIFKQLSSCMLDFYESDAGNQNILRMVAHEITTMC